MVGIQSAEDFKDFSNAVIQRLDYIDERLQVGQAFFTFFRDAMKAVRKRHLELDAVPWRFLSRMSQDVFLRLPHRKLLHRLAQRYDFERGCFLELSFSKLVRDAHVGKQAARGYLGELQSLGYVFRRGDGYRIWFRIRDDRVDRP